ncbi:TetR family transcriptional regulator [Paenarthrobacter sp. UW852]|uniref:TetR/AcrR family transcriptional regulator n=1 Tax=Paenarthrobacter sp. UW852 TaxID=2951989 RepID=UPI002147A424|nr:TetR family transcriptional regulator [Paenarthrobacter sp. UW852]MCR1161514.1 TetR family transcriptional regulator [Paenarthrobacter sp. UW852]
MAWDTERTKGLLLSAATTEFCTRGLAGARIDRIAAEAGVNKERIYQYFGNKNALFDAVIVTALTNLMDEVPIEGSGPEAMADYAGRLFDHHRVDATAPRLLFWEGLERGTDVVGLPKRMANCASKVNSTIAALPGISREDAGDLLITIVSLCDSAPVLPALDGLMAGDNPGRTERRRAAVVRTVHLMAAALAAEAAASEAATA